MRQGDCLPRFVASHKTSDWKVRIGGGEVEGRGGDGGQAPAFAVQCYEGWRLKTGMTRLEMTPIRAALTLDPLSPLAPHRIFMLLGPSLPFQARG